MKKIIALCLLSTSLLGQKAPKNVILLIGDGMGVSQIYAGLTANRGHLNLERVKVIGFHKNQASDNYVTDSAAGATAFATGKQTYNGAIGLDSLKVPSVTLLEMAELIAEQIYIFEKVAIPLGAKMHHVKLHGALYNDCAKDAALSKIFIQTIQAINPDLIVYGLSGSHTIQQAKNFGQPFANEVFADRTYQNNGQLTPRYLDNALIYDPEIASAQAIKIIFEKKVSTIHEEDISIIADTICIHGDGLNAIPIAAKLHEVLKQNNIEIKYP